MESLRNIKDHIGLYISVLATVQNYVYHNRSKRQDEKLHDNEIEFLINAQINQIKEIKRTYLMRSYHDMERHFQQLNSDLVNSSREFEKDMVDQRILWCNTIIIASTIMTTALIAVLIQGVLPDFTDHPHNQLLQNVYIAYAISNASSAVFLFLAIVLYVEIVYRISKFNIERSKSYRYFLATALKAV